MDYRRLGRTNFLVSEIGFGCEWLEQMELEEGRALFQACEESGINILDCWSPNPKVRSIIGESIKGRRERWFIQGHIGSTWQNGQYVRTREFPIVEEAFEDQLKRFHSDYVDLGMIHYVDSVKEWDEIVSGPFIEYARRLKESGKIRAVGLSSHNPQVAKKAVNSGEIDALMFSINPAFDITPPTEDVYELFKTETYVDSLAGIHPERAELYRLCEQKNVGITVMKGFGGGRLFKAETSPLCVALTAVQALHYALTRPAVASVLVGFSEVRHVTEAVGYETATDEQKDYSELLANAPKHAYRGQCAYCNHCKPCPVNIDIAAVNKFYDLAVMQPTVPASVREHYRALERNASDCLGCRSCEQRCPFGVKIAERMKLAAELFK